MSFSKITRGIFPTKTPGTLRRCFEVFDNVVQTGWPALVIDITDLPDLEYLSVTGPAHSIEELLWLIWFPPATVVHLDVWQDVSEFSTIAIEHDVRFGQEVTRVRMWKCASLLELTPAIRFGASIEDDDLKPHFEITVRDHDAGRWMTVVNCFARKVMSDSVYSLALTLPFSEYSGEAVVRWIEVLDRFPKLKVLFPKHLVLRALDDSDRGTTGLSSAKTAPLVKAVPETPRETQALPLSLTTLSFVRRPEFAFNAHCPSKHALAEASVVLRKRLLTTIQVSHMPNAVVIHPNEPDFKHGPALASRDNITCLMNVVDLPCDESGRISDEAISEFLGCDARRVCSFFDPKRSVFNWHYSLYAGHSGTINDVANIVQTGAGLSIRGPAVVVKDTPQQLWHKLDTSISVAELAASLWSYHKTGMDVAQVYGERALIRWLGTS
ncbi:hypothetical protein K488DRAFT_70003 [Vararia minispora EC-137]|uniref:Uncharacterized protein n=1 Tax=Vararia minispora EC-137 TaxID=1314806 RepID=A0ACB8QP93_9AGAM|nr:hypothetical protein K488DRAFT_70003 [Vararia minispora EC-137]